MSVETEEGLVLYKDHNMMRLSGGGPRGRKQGLHTSNMKKHDSIATALWDKP